MLLRQAALSFTAWTDADAPLDVMRQALRAELGPATDA
jgi:shikimate 5-dehydrogenase